MAEAVIFVGVQGSGKTTYYRNHFAETHVLISGDVHGSRERQAAVLDDCIRTGQSFVLDNTNVDRVVRAPYVHRAKAAGYRVVCCFFDTPLRTAIARNNHRVDKKPIPVPALLRSAKNLQAPAIEEGFDEIRVIRPDVG